MCIVINYFISFTQYLLFIQSDQRGLFETSYFATNVYNLYIYIYYIYVYIIYIYIYIYIYPGIYIYNIYIRICLYIHTITLL